MKPSILLFTAILYLSPGIDCKQASQVKEESSAIKHTYPAEGDFNPNQLNDDELKAIADLVVKYAPLYWFDKSDDDPTKDFCYPDDATDFYNKREIGDWSRQCNTNYSTLFGDIPTYWHAQPCHENLHIAYWTFYGYNHNCNSTYGGRDAWWESITLKVRNWNVYPTLGEVMYGQKEGWYTRVPERYDIIDATHPVAYVGKSSHGFYHDEGGKTSSCCYFDDERKPGGPDHYMRTQSNLVQLRKDGNGEDWMTDSSEEYWNGIKAPTFRDSWNLCNLKGCNGSKLLICGTCGCHKSDYGSDEPF